MPPRLHFAPAKGWMNDPNGLVHWQGRHHLFYQHNPDGTEFTDQHWGHASSPDLLTWTEHEVALFPGPARSAPYDATACFTVEDTGALLVSVIPEDGEEGPAVWWMTGTTSGTGFEVREVGPADVGDRFYAPQSYWTSDGRRIQFGWIRTHEDPAGLGRPSVGAMTLPRELSVRQGRLHTEPAAELARLRLAATPVPAPGRGEDRR